MGEIEMSIHKKQNRDSIDITAIMNNIVFKSICKIQNGSITIIKQDNSIIQVNVNEKIHFEKQIENEDFVEGVLL